MFKSESLSNLLPALVKAQGQFKPAVKDAINPHFKSRYVDLAGVLDACRDALAANGLSVVQPTEIDDKGLVVLVTTLFHASGEFLGGRYPVAPTKPDPQGFGAALSYARRYTLMSLLGIAAEDDDGNAASGHGMPQQQQQRREPPPPRPANGAGERAESWSDWLDRAAAKTGLNKYQLNNHIFKWLFGEAEADTATRFRNVAARWAKERAEIIDEVKAYVAAEREKAAAGAEREPGQDG